jgi:adenylosuccinate lyase
MLQAFGEIEEPFEKEQIGSSAMAYKRNPMRSERIAALARFVLSLEPNANQTHACSTSSARSTTRANRRLAIPESFLATDAILILLENIVTGLEVHPARIRRARQRRAAVHGHRGADRARRARGRRPPGGARGDPRHSIAARAP